MKIFKIVRNRQKKTHSDTNIARFLMLRQGAMFKEFKKEKRHLRIIIGALDNSSGVRSDYFIKTFNRFPVIFEGYKRI